MKIIKRYISVLPNRVFAKHKMIIKLLNNQNTHILALPNEDFEIENNNKISKQSKYTHIT